MSTLAGINPFAPPRIAKRKRIRFKDAYLFIAPSMIVIAMFVVYPILRALWMSIHDWSFLNPDHLMVGLGNYAELFKDARFWNSLKITAVYTVVSVPLQIILAILAAMAFHERIRFVSFFRSVYFFPVISSFAVMAIVWTFLLDPDIGLVSHWLVRLGIPPVPWLQSTTFALPVVIFVGIWKTIGFNMVIVLAGLDGISETYYEAASIDGAGPFAQFWNVTIPGLRQSLVFVTAMAFIASLQAFDQVYVMTHGGPLFSTETLVTYIYHQGFELFRMGYAAAISVALFLLIMMGAVLQLKSLRYQDVD
jgi:multiple sugar transport system permease protein